MSHPEDRARELKLAYPAAPKPMGLYKPTVRVGHLLFTSLHGWAVERLGYRALRNSTRLAPLISAIGMSIFLQNYVQLLQGARNKALHPLGNDAAVDCALRRYAARRAYSIAQPGDLLDELNRVIPGAERRLRAWGIHR